MDRLSLQTWVSCLDTFPSRYFQTMNMKLPHILNSWNQIIFQVDYYKNGKKRGRLTDFPLFRRLRPYKDRPPRDLGTPPNLTLKMLRPWRSSGGIFWGACEESGRNLTGIECFAVFMAYKYLDEPLISLYLVAGIQCTLFSLVAISRAMQSPLLHHFLLDHVLNSLVCP